MNIALPALVIILGLLPGIVFFHGYFSGRFPKQMAAISGMSELALYVLFAVPLDALALGVMSLYGIHLQYGLISRLLLGHDPSGDVGTALARTITTGWAVSAKTYVATLLGSFLAGNVFRKLVWMFRVDIWVPFLRMKHEWFYVLQGRLHGLPRAIVPYADVLVEQPPETQLYQGIVSSFEIDRSGGISQLILRDAYRGKGRGDDFHWRTVPGDRFILMGAAIRSINMRYIVLEGPRSVAGTKALRLKVRRLFRSFMFEEP